MYEEVSQYIEGFTKVINNQGKMVKVKSFYEADKYQSQGSTVVIEDMGLESPVMSEVHPQPGQIYMRESKINMFAS